MFYSAPTPDSSLIASSSMQAIGIRLLSSRLVLQLSQTDMADKLLVQPNSLCHWERGRNYPDRLAIIRLADSFHLTTDWIYRGITRGIEAETAQRLEKTFIQQLTADANAQQEQSKHVNYAPQNKSPEPANQKIHSQHLNSAH